MMTDSARPTPAAAPSWSADTASAQLRTPVFALSLAISQRLSSTGLRYDLSPPNTKRADSLWPPWVDEYRAFATRPP
jgi:hypothetical protein